MQNTRNEPNSAHMNPENGVTFASRVREMVGNPMFSDHDLEQNIKSMLSQDSGSMGYSGNVAQPQTMSTNSLFRGFPFNDSFFGHSPFQNSLLGKPLFSNPLFSKPMFPSWDDYDWPDTNIEPDEDDKKSSSYVKYNSSVTSYDKNGNRESKSVSHVSRVKDGVRSVHKKMTYEDKDGKTVHEFFPDGTEKKTVTNNAANSAIQQ